MTNEVPTIVISIKNVYGEAKYYPVCDKAKAFARIAGTKTLTRDVIREISDMGYYIDIEQQSLDIFVKTKDALSLVA